MATPEDAASGGRPGTNELGIHDMSGNVGEWVNTRNNFLATAEAYRGYRGGSWHLSDKGCRVGFAACNDPKRKIGVIGFRVARTLLDESKPALGEETIPRDVGDSKNTAVALALATRSETPERAEIAKEALSLLKPEGAIDLTKECSLFEFINDPGPASYKQARMPADKHLVLESLRGPITGKELDGLKRNYLDYETPTTNWVNYHFRRWYVPFMGEWIYQRSRPGRQDKGAQQDD